MKIYPFTIPKTDKNFLIYQEDVEFKFYDKFHRHKEIQLSYIEKGNGTLIVSDSINDFSEGDIILLGSNVPHLFKNDISQSKSKMISLFFNYDDSIESPFDLEDLKELTAFLDKSKNGVRFRNVDKSIKQIFEELNNKSSIQRFMKFLDLLYNLSEYEPIPLSNFHQRKTYSSVQENRMKRVMDYSVKNFRNGITLDEISKIANLTKHSFCKYFKNHTNKSFTEFVNELKINHAAKLLITSKELIIVEVAENSGFNNLSHFNRQFKRFKSVSPKEYRKKYLE